MLRVLIVGRGCVRLVVGWCCVLVGMMLSAVMFLVRFVHCGHDRCQAVRHCSGQSVLLPAGALHIRKERIEPHAA